VSQEGQVTTLVTMGWKDHPGGVAVAPDGGAYLLSQRDDSVQLWRLTPDGGLHELAAIGIRTDWFLIVFPLFMLAVVLGFLLGGAMWYRRRGRLAHGGSPGGAATG
jgi:hypothetical protein